jgi:endonuclease/exonuclease/phosphatase (EEP) superfamily protein YafD
LDPFPAGDGSTVSPSMGIPIRLMTSNLLNGGADADSLAEVLDRMRPDVVVTQELGYEYVDVLTKRYNNHYLNPADDFTGRGIATRLEAVFGDIPMPVRMGTSATLDVGATQWNLAGVHLLSPIQFPWWTSVSGRTGQLEAIDHWNQTAKGPTILAGDFNASPSWPAYRHLAERWHDLVVDHGSVCGVRPEKTWGWRPGWPRLLRIDHVFGSGVTATDVSVVPIKGSDHDAVVVDLVAAVR